MDLKLNSEELKIGENMLTFAKELFPLNRSIMGPDIRKSFNYFCDKHKEFKKIYFNSGDMVFDWQTHSTKPDGVPWDVYYDMFQPEIYEEYTAAETIMNCVDSGHAGPW